MNDNIQSLDLQGHAGTIGECAACHGASVPQTVSGGPHGMHPVGSSWVDRHEDAAEGGLASCRACHGADDRGTVLSRGFAERTLKTRARYEDVRRRHDLRLLHLPQRAGRRREPSGRRNADPHSDAAGDRDARPLDDSDGRAHEDCDPEVDSDSDPDVRPTSLRRRPVPPRPTSTPTPTRRPHHDD